MGYIRHHSIIVTSAIREAINKAHAKAFEIFGGQYISLLIESNINGYHSFFIPPDGSKEGWEDSNTGDDRRKQFIEWINNQAYDDGSNSISFVEVFYGDDNGESEVVNHN